jgi:hypothetical protein
MDSASSRPPPERRVPAMDMAPRPIRETRRLPSMACCIRELVSRRECRRKVHQKAHRREAARNGVQDAHPGVDLDLADTQPTSVHRIPTGTAKRGTHRDPFRDAGRAYP